MTKWRRRRGAPCRKSGKHRQQRKVDDVVAAAALAAAAAVDASARWRCRLQEVRFSLPLSQLRCSGHTATSCWRARTRCRRSCLESWSSESSPTSSERVSSRERRLSTSNRPSKLLIFSATAQKLLLPVLSNKRGSYNEVSSLKTNS